MQTNGTALSLDMFFVELPGVVDHELIQVAWGQLQRHYRDKGVELPAELVWCAPQNHAMLAYMCSEWTSRKSNISTAHKLVQSVKIGKLMPEVRESRSIGGGGHRWFWAGPTWWVT